MVRMSLAIAGFAAGLAALSSVAFADPSMGAATHKQQIQNSQTMKSSNKSPKLKLVDTMERDGGHFGKLGNGNPYQQPR